MHFWCWWFSLLLRWQALKTGKARGGGGVLWLCIPSRATSADSRALRHLSSLPDRASLFIPFPHIISASIFLSSPPLPLPSPNPVGRPLCVLHGECPLGVLWPGDLPSFEGVARRRPNRQGKTPRQRRSRNRRKRVLVLPHTLPCVLRCSTRPLRPGCDLQALPGVPNREGFVCVVEGSVDSFCV